MFSPVRAFMDWLEDLPDSKETLLGIDPAL